MAQPQTNEEDPLHEKLEEIVRLYLADEPIDDILPRVDEVFGLLTDLEQMYQLLDFLPRSLTTKNFIQVLEKETSKRSSQIAKANLSSVLEMKLDDGPSQRKLYLLMHECLGFDGAHAADSQHMLLKYLATFNKVDETTEQVETKACQAILNTLRLPIWQFDEVSDLVPIRSLAASKNASNRELYRLFDIICYKGDNEYQSYITDNENLINEWGLSTTLLNEKVRLLSLCRMAQDKKTQDNSNLLTYSEIASALNINEDEVEGVIIRAIGLKLLSARVDQVKKTVRVGYTHHAMFTHDQWKQLQETLGAWKKNIADLLGRFDELKNHNASIEVA